MKRSGSQKFAVLLCKFSDSPDVEPQSVDFCRDLFANRGTGGLNDYWADAIYSRCASAMIRTLKA